MPFTLQSQTWPGRDAVLLVHGIGNDPAGTRSEANVALRAALGDDADRFAIYELRYDGIDDWFKEKTQAAALVLQLVALLKKRFGDDSLGETAAEFAGDVIFPVLSLSARAALREAFISQLNKMIQDGPHGALQRISVVCHSMGCFHTYEAIHAAVDDAAALIGPQAGVYLQNVVFMASPVQLIKTVVREMGPLIPKRTTLALNRSLRMPVAEMNDVSQPYVLRNFVSIAGDLDPVGGFLLRQKLDWAYMNVPGQKAFIDQQSALGIDSAAQLRDVLLAALRSKEPPQVTVQNPHDWSAYIDRHAEDLREWLVV
ncbi:MAG: hypothetical protein MNPFHGCM_02507 [Gemmatimonadaceae bacterium]|nr:hypothetical protein [Gemmatimonadaceae bacterium]